MDVLRQLSQSVFDTSEIFPTRASSCRLSAFKLAVSAGKELSGKTDRVTHSQAELSKGELVPWVQDIGILTGTASSGSDAVLKLVCIDRDAGGTLAIPKDAFRDLFSSLCADPAALYMVCHQYDGYHSFHDIAHLPTWFVGTSAHALLWTFDAARVRTVGIFIHRRRSNFKDFCNFVGVYAGCAYTPYLMLYASCIHQQHRFDTETASELASIHDIERCTGFGPPSAQNAAVSVPVSGEDSDSGNYHQWLPQGSKAGIDELTAWSQAVGEVGAKIANKMRHQSTSAQMLETFKEAQVAGAQGLNIPPGPLKERYEASQTKLHDALPSVERHMTTYKEYLIYLKFRTDRLSSVLFILLTHVDARASINLAAASKRDGSSMKTIAVMTMAFLPGTFLATLFCMPWFQSQEPDVTKAGFRMYWAITLPVTTVVFLVWLFIIERKWILHKLASYWNREIYGSELATSRKFKGYIS